MSLSDKKIEILMCMYYQNYIDIEYYDKVMKSLSEGGLIERMQLNIIHKLLNMIIEEILEEQGK